MLVLLPTEGHFEAFAEDLDVERLAEIEAALAPTDLVLFLPRVAYGTDLSLAETLADMGMTLAFSERQANFTGMGEIPPGLYISNVLHKAYVSMNELGTEAAAATAVEVAEGSEETLPVIMRVDRPFIFVIRDAEQGAILFMGRVVNPTVR